MTYLGSWIGGSTCAFSLRPCESAVTLDDAIGCEAVECSTVVGSEAEIAEISGIGADGISAAGCASETSEPIEPKKFTCRR